MDFFLPHISVDVVRMSLVAGLSIGEAWVLQNVIDGNLVEAISVIDSFLSPDELLMGINLNKIGHTPLTLGILGLLKSGAYDLIRERLEEIIDAKITSERRNTPDNT